MKYWRVLTPWTPLTLLNVHGDSRGFKYRYAVHQHSQLQYHMGYNSVCLRTTLPELYHPASGKSPLPPWSGTLYVVQHSSESIHSWGLTSPWHLMMKFEAVWYLPSNSIMYVLLGMAIVSLYLVCGMTNWQVLAISPHVLADIITVFFLSAERTQLTLNLRQIFRRRKCDGGGYTVPQ